MLRYKRTAVVTLMLLVITNICLSQTRNINFGIMSNIDSLRGFQGDIISATTRSEMRGVNMSLFATVNRGNSYGVSLSGILNTSMHQYRGIQVGGLSTMAYAINGVQLSALSNVSVTPFRGIQLSGMVNVSRGVKRGIQLAAATNISTSYMRGLQMSAFNYSDTLNGSQVGLINICVNHPRGIQVGIINYSRDTIAHKIGLVNVNPKTSIDMMLFGGTSTKLNIAMRFRNRSTYNILGLGTHYMGLDEKFSGALYYRIGQYFHVLPRLTMSGDIGYYHIETFQEQSDKNPERLYSLQCRLNADYMITKKCGAFASVGYGDTRYYNNSQKYKKGMIFEMGLTINYNNIKK